MSDKIGLECKVYRTASPITSTTYSSFAWLEAKNVKDVTITLTKTRADMSTRASTWRNTRGALKEGPVNFQIKWDPDDDLCSALLSSWLNNTKVGLAFLDGDEGGTNAQGRAGNWECMEFTRNEPLEEGVMIDVVVEPREYTGWYYTGS